MRFLLDEHFSEHVARALETCDFPVCSSKDIPELGRGTPDRKIAVWCGDHDHVWVTVDRDSRSREMRMQTLPAAGTKVVLLKHDPKGRGDQLRVIVRNIDKWMDVVGRYAGHGAWLQSRQGNPKKLTK